MIRNLWSYQSLNIIQAPDSSLTACKETLVGFYRVDLFVEEESSVLHLYCTNCSVDAGKAHICPRKASHVLTDVQTQPTVPNFTNLYRVLHS